MIFLANSVCLKLPLLEKTIYFHIFLFRGSNASTLPFQGYYFNKNNWLPGALLRAGLPCPVGAVDLKALKGRN